jgi:tuftelin-interacting protein 11
MQLVLEAVAAAAELAAAGGDLEDLARRYRSLQVQYREEYLMYNLSAAALAQALPRVQTATAGWSPLLSPTAHAALYAAWRPVLEGDAAQQAVFVDDLSATSDAYVRLVAETVLPALRHEITSSWDPR